MVPVGQVFTQMGCMPADTRSKHMSHLVMRLVLGSMRGMLYGQASATALASAGLSLADFSVASTAPVFLSLIMAPGRAMSATSTHTGVTQWRHWSGKKFQTTTPSLVSRSLKRTILRLLGLRSGGFWCEPRCLVSLAGRSCHSLQAS